MALAAVPCPRTTRQLIDEHFLEYRSRLLDIAAFLDRLDRAAAPAAETDAIVDAGTTTEDFRLRAFHEALQLLCSETAARAERIQRLLSDPATGTTPRAGRTSPRGASDHDREEVE